jgi:hypothetical protein
LNFARVAVERRELDQHLRHVRARLARRHVVVDERVVVPQVREPVANLGALREVFFYELQCTVGGREARAVRRLDVHGELRRVRAREQAETDHRHERDRSTEHGRGGEQRRARPRERAAQRGPVDAVDAARQRAQRGVTLGRMRLTRQQPAREKRDDREGYQQRRADRIQHGRRQRPDEHARPAR